MNGRQVPVPMGRLDATLSGRAGVTLEVHMNIKVTVTLRFEIALSVSGLAALLWLLS